jgi:hypothetical protein
VISSSQNSLLFLKTVHIQCNKLVSSPGQHLALTDPEYKIGYLPYPVLSTSSQKPRKCCSKYGSPTCGNLVDYIPSSGGEQLANRAFFILLFLFVKCTVNLHNLSTAFRTIHLEQTKPDEATSQSQAYYGGCERSDFQDCGIPLAESQNADLTR